MSKEKVVSFEDLITLHQKMEKGEGEIEVFAGESLCYMIRRKDNGLFYGKRAQYGHSWNKVGKHFQSPGRARSSFTQSQGKWTADRDGCEIEMVTFKMVPVKVEEV